MRRCVRGSEASPGRRGRGDLGAGGCDMARGAGSKKGNGAGNDRDERVSRSGFRDPAEQEAVG